MVVQQIQDPFRIGMIFFLLLTALRTRAAMGMVMPLALGVLFVAAVIPLTTQAVAYPAFEEKVLAFAYGIVSNMAILGVCLAGWLLIRRMRG